MKINATVYAPITLAGEIAGSGGATSNRGSQLTVDQSDLSSTQDPLVVITNYSSARITNSILRGAPANAINFDLTTLASSVSFSTFYNTRWVCQNAAAIFTSRNNIFLNESVGAGPDTVVNSSCVHFYDLIKPQSSAVAGSNNIVNLDPRLIDAANGNMHLAAGSPAIDAADPTATESVDLDGTQRPQGGARDIGAFEFKP